MSGTQRTVTASERTSRGYIHMSEATIARYVQEYKRHSRYELISIVNRMENTFWQLEVPSRADYLHRIDAINRLIEEKTYSQY